MEVAALVTTVIEALVLAYHAAFFHTNSNTVPVLVTLELLALVHIYGRLQTGVVTAGGQLVMDFPSIRQHYWSNGCTRDMLSSCPFGLVFLAYQRNSSGSTSSLRIISLLQLVHLLRLSYVPRYFHRKEGELRTRVVTLRIIKFSTLVAVSTQL